MKRKIISSLLAVAMCTGSLVVPLTAQAATVPKPKIVYKDNMSVNELSSYVVSDFIDLAGNKIAGVESSKSKPAAFYDSDFDSAISFSNLLSDFLSRGIIRNMPAPTSVPQYSGGYEEKTEEESVEADVVADEAAPTAEVSGGHSTTNVQVEGVDEADIIKTDGKYIYYLNRNSGVSVVETNGANMKVVSRITSQSLGGASNFSEMYLSGSKLILLGQRYDIGSQVQNYPQNIQTNDGYSVAFIMDMSDKSTPKVSRVLQMAGHFVTTRFTNNTLYMITNSYGYSNQSLDKLPLVQLLPQFYDSALSNNMMVVPPNRIRLPQEKESLYSLNYTMIGAVDITDPKTPLRPTAILGSIRDVYMNHNALYFSRPVGMDGMDLPVMVEPATVDFYVANTEKTNIYRYTIDGPKIRYDAYNSFQGYLLNQYSMDEYKGYFRLASTSYTTNDSSVYVFDIKNKMKQVGKVTGLGPTERIYSVRFKGNTGYVVTFRQMDPLYVLDLSDPTKPKTLGELKIPGFSSYLHPYLNNYVIGIGREVAVTYTKDTLGKLVPVGTQDAGLKLSLFDVANPRQPKEIAKKVIGATTGTQSEATNNPKALMMDLAKHRFAMPISYVAISKAGNFDQKNSWAGGLVVGVDVKKGFTIQAQMKARDLDSQWGWYGDGSSRFVYIGNTLYFVSENVMRAYNYTTFKELSSIKVS